MGKREVKREVLPGGDIMIWFDNDKVRRVESEQHKRDRVHFAQFDMFKRGHKVPERVCILGPGINAANEDAYKKITADYIIAVNYAVLISQCEAVKDKWPTGKNIDAWLVCEYDVDAVPWFKKMFKILDVRRYFSTNTCVGVVDIPHPWGDDGLYTFALANRAMKTRVFNPDECRNGRFHPDTTVVGVAASVAVALGAKHVELCGCDLMGNTYYDDTHRNLPQYTDVPHPNADRLDSCLSYLVNKQDIEIVTLSSTILESPKR